MVWIVSNNNPATRMAVKERDIIIKCSDTSLVQLSQCTICAVKTIIQAFLAVMFTSHVRTRSTEATTQVNWPLVEKSL